MDADTIRAELERILAFDDMRSSRQMSGFLRFVVEETLAGRTAQLKERTIAIKALNRDTDFDPRIDPIVRVAAARLRRVLERYNLSLGASDDVRIDLPKGTYVPRFTSRSESVSDESITSTPRSSDSILRTKLYAPPVAPDFVRQASLLERLDRHRHLPVTLVSAPAGYGKSTLLSAWLGECNVPGAWLALDGDDNDLREFVGGLVAAVQTVYPGAATATRALLTSPDLPPVAQLSRRLLNELVTIGGALVLVLDDYQVIHEQAVHDLLNAFLRHPPPSMHLAILTREDPPLDLDRLRGQGHVLELSMFDLRFTPAEVAEFIDKALHIPLSDATARAVAERIEGWPVGLRLLSQSLRHEEDLERTIDSLQGGRDSIARYLISEVLSRIPAETANHLLTMSILDRFCEPLCDELCAEDHVVRARGRAGRSMITWLEEHNVFLIPLDVEHRWFRFHHLLRDLLRDLLRRQRDRDELVELHARASAWFEHHGLLDEAFQYAMRGEGAAAAVRVIKRNGHALVDDENLVRLERWLGQIPDEIALREPTILAFRAWLARCQVDIDTMKASLDRSERLLEAGHDDAALVRGTVSGLRAFERYLAHDLEGCLAAAKQALETIPAGQLIERCFVTNLQAGAQQMAGRFRESSKLIDARLADPSLQDDRSQIRLLTGLGCLAWLEADLPTLEQAARRLIAMAGRTGRPLHASRARFLLAAAHHQRNELTEAERLLAPVVDDESVYHASHFANAAALLAMCRQAMGRVKEARDLADIVIERARTTKSAYLDAVGQALHAELGLRDGHLTHALRWAHAFAFDRAPPSLCFDPELTVVRALVTEDSEASRRRLDKLVARLEATARETHNRSVLIPLLAMKALSLDARNDEAASFDALAEAMVLAEPGLCLRFFIDLGAPMADLLERYAARVETTAFTRRLLSAFEGDPPVIVVDVESREGEPGRLPAK